MNDGVIPFLQGKEYTLPAGSPSNLAGGRDLAGNHPFAITPATSPALRTPPAGDPVKLDQNQRLQCTSCHEPHEQNIDPVAGKFLVKRNAASALCLTCHVTPGWSEASHRKPSNSSDDERYTSQNGAHTGYTGVSQNGCESCHRPHTAGQGQELLKLPEQYTCYQCHDGTVALATGNIRTEFQAKVYHHPVDITPSAHDPAESPTYARSPLPETSPGAPRHSNCADCHNPHDSNAATAQPPMVSGSMAGVSGQSSAGAYLPSATREYEICFKCHAESANKPQMLDTSNAGIGFGRNPQRQSYAGNPNRYNTRLEFAFGASFHPVTRAGNLSSGPGGVVRSLRPQPINLSGAPMASRTLSATSEIYCSDCHNNDTGRNAGISTGPAGPHGSNIPHLLERAHELEMPPAAPGGRSAGVAYSPASYALCNKCHDLTILMDDRDDTIHREHVMGQNAACSTCHDPHASSSPMLINFDLSIVGPATSGQLQYTQQGTGSGTCTLRCHGEDHNRKSYGSGANMLQSPRAKR